MLTVCSRLMWVTLLLMALNRFELLKHCRNVNLRTLLTLLLARSFRLMVTGPATLVGWWNVGKL